MAGYDFSRNRPLSDNYWNTACTKGVEDANGAGFLGKETPTIRLPLLA
jgi:hypothetical protein